MAQQFNIYQGRHNIAEIDDAIDKINNLKTVNNESLYGPGNITVQAGSSLTTEQQNALNTLIEQQNPLTITVNGNGGVKERGTSVTPAAQITVKRGSTDVTAQSTITSSGGAVIGGSFADSATTTAKTYTFNAAYNGKSVSASLSYSFCNYRYRGQLSSVPSTDGEVLTAIQSASKELSEVATLGATNLSAGKYYIFAVVGTHTFEVRENSTNGVVTAEKQGTLSVPRVNGSGSDNYSYVIVPASSMAWTFKIV